MIELQSLRVDYENVTAVVDLNLTIPQGEVFGLVGPNGAGKTSTIKAIAGILEPTYGEIKIAGIDFDLEREKALTFLGYMPDFSPVYEHLKVFEYLDVFAAAYHLPKDERRKRTAIWLERLELNGKRDELIKNLSRGMRQRLVLAKTLIPEPSVLLLDEPASGMDPISRAQLRDILKQLAQQGTTVLISSHILTELSSFCTSIGIMEKGRLVLSGTIDQIRSKIGSSRKLIIRLAETDTAARNSLIKHLENTPHVQFPKETSIGIFEMNFSKEEKVASLLLKALMSEGHPIFEFVLQKDSIEDIFFKVGAREVS